MPASHDVVDEVLNAASADRYARLVGSVVDDLAARIRTVEQPFTGASRADLQAAVDAVDLDGPGQGNETALAEVTDLYVRNAVWFHHPSYAAHLNCPVVLPAVAAEAALAAVNTSVDTYDQSTVATLMERRLVGWTAGRIGFDDGDGVFTSGGTQSNLQALFCAREAIVARAAETGRRRTEVLPRLKVLTGASSHFSVNTAARLLGLDDDAVVTVDVDALGRVRPAALRRAIDQVHADGHLVMAVVATAGTTDRGCVDPLQAIADVCHGEDGAIWLHVDAAYGCGLLVSSTRRHLLDGIERARSVTVDYHKSFFQPVSASALIVREASDLAPVAWYADYLNPVANAEPNQVDKSLQTTRRFDALKLWTTLRSVGADGLGELFDRVCDLAADVHRDLADDTDFDLVAPTDLSTVLFRYQPAGMTDADADRLVPPVRRLLFDSGRAMVTKTVVEGRPCFKLTLLNPASTVADVHVVLDLVRSVAATLHQTRTLDSLEMAR
ncbi:L-2,4-diaminobutyrate decarboxylase [Paraoerskovia marina]|uniref:L-2,4-diaminobutyrate decarboxylase n=1 Tax=Paraoerskovia marina TaxID=545619 RepID=A0A1H1T031_9CELL|nr:pyridoxal-dependent decarboxylase [Paraoerskovia marina]SDS53336.1 L-2,4-diaminobutyrate decarboxylase [Paraoerskovia marina]